MVICIKMVDPSYYYLVVAIVIAVVVVDLTAAVVVIVAPAAAIVVVAFVGVLYHLKLKKIPCYCIFIPVYVQLIAPVSHPSITVYDMTMTCIITSSYETGGEKSLAPFCRSLAPTGTL